MDNALHNKNALITGAGKRTGIGYGIAKKLASKETTVANRLRRESTEDIVKRIRDAKSEIEIEQVVETGDFWPTGNIWDLTRIRQIKVMAKRIPEANKLNVHHASDTDDSLGLSGIWQNWDGGEWVDARSILSLLSLAAKCGTVLHVRAAGADAEEAVEALGVLIEKDYTDELR